MKLQNNWKSMLLIAAIVFAENAHAVKPGEEEEKECRKPRFRDFSPAHLSVIPPESTITFHVSRGTDPASVTAEAKGENMPVSVVDKTSFMIATARLPADLRDGFARIHITAKAADGGCLGQDGWLLKIGETAPAVQQAKTAAQQ